MATHGLDPRAARSPTNDSRVPGSYDGAEEPPILRYVDGPSTEVRIDIAAPPERWTLVTDLELPARFSNEFQGAELLDGATVLASGAASSGATTTRRSARGRRPRRSRPASRAELSPTTSAGSTARRRRPGGSRSSRRRPARASHSGCGSAPVWRASPAHRRDGRGQGVQDPPPPPRRAPPTWKPPSRRQVPRRRLGRARPQALSGRHAVYGEIRANARSRGEDDVGSALAGSDPVDWWRRPPPPFWWARRCRRRSTGRRRFEEPQQGGTLIVAGNRRPVDGPGRGVQRG